MDRGFVALLAVGCLVLAGCRREEEKPTDSAKASTPAKAAESSADAARDTPPKEQAAATAEPSATATPQVEAARPDAVLPGAAAAVDQNTLAAEAVPPAEGGATGHAEDTNGSSPAAGTGEPAGEDVYRTAIKLPTEVLDRYLGYYQMRPGLLLHVTRENDQLFVQVTAREKYPVYAETETRFFYVATAADLTFENGDSGEVEALTLHVGGNRQVARRMPPDFKPSPPKQEVSVAPAVLESYVGEYEINEKRKVSITLDNGQLHAQLTDQPRVDIFPLSERRFFYKVIDAEIAFVVKPDGQVIALTIHEGERETVAKKLN